MAVTTPAGINPFLDPNWGMLANFLIGPAGNGIGLDENGALLNLFSSSSMTASLPLAISGGNITLNYTGPLYLSGNKLALAVASYFNFSGGSLGLTVGGALKATGGSLSLATLAPLGQSGGTLTIQLTNPIFYDAGSGGVYLKFVDPLYVDGSGNLAIGLGEGLTLDINGDLTIGSDSGSNSMASGLFTWDGTPPSNLSTAYYRWIQTGNLVTLFVRMIYITAGSGNTAVTFALPGGMPAPATLDNQTDTYETIGTGTVATNQQASGVNDYGISGLYKNGDGSFTVGITTLGPSIAAKAAWCTIQYLT